jgi:hypothetical protein
VLGIYQPACEMWFEDPAGTGYFNAEGSARQGAILCQSLADALQESIYSVRNTLDQTWLGRLRRHRQAANTHGLSLFP